MTRNLYDLSEAAHIEWSKALRASEYNYAALDSRPCVSTDRLLTVINSGHTLPDAEYIVFGTNPVQFRRVA